MALSFRRRKKAVTNGTVAILGPSLERGQHDDTAIVSTKRSLTFRELDKLSSRVANALVTFGIKRQERVALMISDRPAFIYVYLGVMKAGGVPVGINVRAAPDDLAYKLNDSESRLLVSETLFLPVYQEAESNVAHPPKVLLVDQQEPDVPSVEAFIADASDVFEPVAMKMTDMAFWVYSSGTSGNPKAVVHRVSTLYAEDRFVSEILGVGPGDRLFCSSKLFFAFPLGHCFFSALRQGATTILFEGWSSPNNITDMVERHKPTVMFSVPAFFSLLLREKAADHPAYKTVRHFIAAGESLPRNVFNRWFQATGHPILEGIGATETIHMFLSNSPADFVPGTCGKPTPGTRVRLVGDDGRDVTEPGLPGILWVRMDSLATEYWGLDDMSREAFADGWYCTGDMFVCDPKGHYHYQGRNDDMLKISGQWVSPVEIEEIVRQSPELDDAAVVGIPNDDGLVRLALFLAPHNPKFDRATLERDLQRTLKGHLSIYKCPRRFFYLDQLPRTSTGKVQRYLLRQIAADQIGITF